MKMTKFHLENSSCLIKIFYIFPNSPNSLNNLTAFSKKFFDYLRKLINLCHSYYGIAQQGKDKRIWIKYMKHTGTVGKDWDFY